MMNLTVCGAGNAGAAIAADCAMGGAEVTLFELAEFEENIRPYKKQGGIVISEDSDPAWKKTGFACLEKITTDPDAAVDKADVIMITVPAMHHTVFWDRIAPHLKDGQIVLFNTGYFGALRHARKRRELGTDVTLAESNIMPYLCSKRGGAIHIARHKRNFRVAAFPGSRTDRVYEIVRTIYPQYEKVPNVLDTNIASGGNPAFHVTLTIPIAGFYLDRYRGGKFYSDTTVMGGRLIEAYDRDRKKLSDCLGSTCYQTITEFERKSYEYEGRDIVEMLRKSEHIDWFATDVYLRQLAEEDIVYAYIPMVRLGEQLGVELPAIRSMTEVMGIMTGEDYWARGLCPDDLDVAGMNREELLAYVMSSPTEV